MKVETHRIISFNMDFPEDVQKLNQLAKIDDIVKSSIKFREFLKSEHNLIEDQNIFKYIEDEYVRIFKENGVEV